MLQNGLVFFVPFDGVGEFFSFRKSFEVFLEAKGDVIRKAQTSNVRGHHHPRVRPEQD